MYLRDIYYSHVRDMQRSYMMAYKKYVDERVLEIGLCIYKADRL